MSSAPVLKGSTFTLSILHIFDDNIEHAIAYLQQKIAQAPNFFAQAPLVLNVERVQGELDFAELKAGICKLGMRPVAVVGCNTQYLKEQAFSHGLAALNAPKGSSTPGSAAKPAAPAASRIVRGTVRSGQQVYAEGGDLIVLGSVSNGAEVLADGSIQIYGTLRGRAIAGAQGEGRTHIICHNLQAELVSIAGDYWLSEQIEATYWQKKVLLSRPGESLHLELLDF